ncbi:MAG TPA: hypothetical protein VFL29_14470 [Candidatus Dormibacteraeota bacterium]|nr:hypothetical protein [Candidatus Dormibacteraeota bacterium]
MSAWLNFAGFLLAFAAVFAAVVYIGNVLERRRTAAYTQFCAANGYQYVADRPDPELDPVVPFSDQGHGRRWRHEISGQYNGVPFTAFEYRYAIGAGRSQQSYTRALIRWTNIGATLPQFTLAPETFFTRIGQLLGWHDIQFADDPEFSATYVLKGEHEMEVASFFSPQLRQQLAAMPGQHAAGAGSTLFWWRERGLPRPDRFAAFLAEGDQVRTILVS